MRICGCELVLSYQIGVSLIGCVLWFISYIFTQCLYVSCFLFSSFQVMLFYFNLYILCLLISCILELLANPSGILFLGHTPGTNVIPEIEGQYDGGAARRDVS